MQISFVQRECNWLQALEGDIDTSHFGFLHAGHVEPDDVPADNLLRYTVTNRAPEFHVTESRWGTMYCAYRPAEAGKTYWRFANFLFPFWTQTPQGPFDRVNTRAWVPMDDTHTMFVSLSWRGSPPSIRPLKDGRMVPGSRPRLRLPAEHDRLVRPLAPPQTPSNDWMIDREAQQSGEIYTGISSIHGQDQAVTESMGGITDHDVRASGAERPDDRAHPAPPVARRPRIEEGRHFPPGVDDPDIYYEVRSGDFLADKDVDWRDAYEAQLRAAIRPLHQAAA